jgi:hypothetical protein
MFAPGTAIGLTVPQYTFASALDAVIEQRKHHVHEAKRLRSVAPTITTPALKARVLEQAQEHAMLAGLAAEAIEVI